MFDAQQHAGRESAVEQARDDLARTFAAAAQAGQTAPTSSESASDWLDALEELLPAAIAADRAAAAATARTTAADQRVAPRRRHPDVGDLLR